MQTLQVTADWRLIGFEKIQFQPMSDVTCAVWQRKRSFGEKEQLQPVTKYEMIFSFLLTLKGALKTHFKPKVNWLLFEINHTAVTQKWSLKYEADESRKNSKFAQILSHKENICFWNVQFIESSLELFINVLLFDQSFFFNEQYRG